MKKTLSTRSGLIEYTDTGSGIPVVFLHGGHSNADEKLALKGFDTSKYRLIVPSRPGYGNTPLKNNGSPFQAATLISELLESLQLKKVVIYGISAGGPTAIHIAAEYPELVHKLVLASAVSKKWLDKDDREYKVGRVMFYPAIEKFTWILVHFSSRLFPQALAKSFSTQFSLKENFIIRPEDSREFLQALRSYSSGHGFINDLEQEIHPSTLSRIECPTMIIHSQYDKSVSIEHATHAHQQIRNSQLLTLNNDWGHLIWIGPEAQQNIAKVQSFIEA